MHNEYTNKNKLIIITIYKNHDSLSDIQVRAEHGTHRLQGDLGDLPTGLQGLPRNLLHLVTRPACEYDVTALTDAKLCKGIIFGLLEY